MDGIIVDTSSILFAFSNRVDIFRRVKLQLGLAPVVSEGVIRELKAKAQGGGRSRAYARLALDLIKNYGINVDKDSGYVDRWIIASSKRYGSVCTNDTKLRRALRNSGSAVYTISRSGEFR
jgi:rRNA-processing protein FCF1